MTKTELIEIIQNGESSGVEFKRDEIQNRELAKEVVAFSNFMGGLILLGVEDSGAVHGTTRPNLEEWAMELCRTKIDPPIIPYFEWVRDVEPGRDVAVLRILPGHNKPYARIHEGRRTYYIRVGRIVREADQNELIQMAQASGRLVYGAKPVAGARLADLDERRLADYFLYVAPQQPLPEGDEWNHLLVNLELMTRSNEVITPTIDGMLLFGRNPKKFLPQSGIRAISYEGATRDYSAKTDEDLKGSLVPLRDEKGEVVENGLVEQALDFIRRNTNVVSRIEGGRRVDRPDYPADVLREVVVNALVHRDYSIVGTDVSIEIFPDRLEVRSPGRLPNTATVDAIKTGFRYARNQTLVNFMRDYRYVDFRGMGIRQKIIPGMLVHSGREPEFAATEWELRVCLFK